MHEIWLDEFDEIWLVNPAQPEIFHGTLSNAGQWKHKAEFIVAPRKLIVTEVTKEADAEYVYRAMSDRHRSRHYDSVGKAKSYRTLNGGKNNSNFIIQRSKLDWENIG